MEYLKVQGDSYERALQQARHFGSKALDDAKQAIGDLSVMPPKLPRFMRQVVGWNLLSSLGRLYHARHRTTLKGYQGGKFARAVEGLAEGFGIPAPSVYGFCAFEIEASRFHYRLGCTSMAFAAGATENGRPMLAYNHDFPPQFRGFPFVRETVPDEGLRSLAVSYPPMLGAICGVNAAGVAVSLNHAWVRKLSSGDALPISLLVQDVLDRCTNVEEALEAAKAVKVPNGSMMTVVDTRGGRVAIELTPQGPFVRGTSGPVLHTFNAYQTISARRLEVPVGAISLAPVDGLDIHGANLMRQARYEELGAALRTRWSDADIDALMSDHGSDGRGCQNSICRHECEKSVTLMTARVDPVGRTLSAGLGFACEAKLDTFSMPLPAAARRAA